MTRLISSNNQCPKCGRLHGGICGVPAGVTKGYGARTNRSENSSFELNGKPPITTQSTAVLEDVLAQAKEQFMKVTELLKIMPIEMSETIALLDRESKLNSVIKQVQQQIEARER